MQKIDNSNRNSFPGAQTIGRFQLANGITVLSYSNLYSKSLTITGMFSGGGALDPPDKVGTAHFTASMLLRGNAHDTFQGIYEKLESVGASLSFSAGIKNTWFTGRSLVKDFPMLLALIFDSLTVPTFPEEYINRLRNQFLTGLLIRDQDTQQRASLEYDRVLFGAHPYGIPVDGYPETIKNIQREDLINHHKTYQPQDTLIAVAGALSLEQIKDQVTSQFENWKAVSPISEPAYPEIQAPNSTIRIHTPIEGKSQTDIQMGTIGPARTSPDYYPAYLGNHVLGQFGLYGRIGRSVRNKEGLAYYAYSSLNALPETGSWEFNAGVNPQNVEKTIALIIAEIKKYLEKPVTASELSDSQTHLIGRLPMSLESNAGIANAMLSIERFDLGLDYFQNYSERLLKITPDEILAVSKAYLDPEKLVIISAGAKTDHEH